MKTITPSILEERMKSDEILLIDVREPAEHRSACIEKDHLIPLGQLTCNNLPKTQATIVLYCQSGNRSHQAGLQLLSEQPNLNILILEGGIQAWQQAGKSVSKSGTFVLPLDRQTQFTAGSLAFLGTLLGTFVHAGFYIIPGFIGAGLMFAGITGWCGMAKLLAKMPWNR